jgi:hypothetical protein
LETDQVVNIDREIKVFNITINLCRIIIFVPLFLMQIATVKSQGFDFKGQFSAWGTLNRSNNDWDVNSGIRYIPQFNYSYSLSENDLLNTEVLFNAFYKTNYFSDDYAFKFYRAILRYTTRQTEIQLGLQKINFGPAQLLRPLMWFDRTDPRDPLKLTDGVYALRYKYSFLDNSLLWLWCLFDNTDTKGYELCPTANNIPEFGGRIQSFVADGEIAATFHTRKVDAMLFEYRENRYALDGRWDIGIGVWFESVLQQNISDFEIYKWNRMTTFGADYTIPEGNGIYIMAEHMITTFSNSILNSDKNSQISAMMMTYSIGVLDNLTLQEYYDWKNKNLYQYFQLQRTYDNFTINAALFHYPENGGNLFLTSKTAPVSGYGLQLTLTYNY